MYVAMHGEIYGGLDHCQQNICRQVTARAAAKRSDRWNRKWRWIVLKILKIAERLFVRYREALSIRILGALKMEPSLHS